MLAQKLHGLHAAAAMFAIDDDLSLTRPGLNDLLTQGIVCQLSSFDLSLLSFPSLSNVQ